MSDGSMNQTDQQQIEAILIRFSNGYTKYGLSRESVNPQDNALNTATAAIAKMLNEARENTAKQAYGALINLESQLSYSDSKSVKVADNVIAKAKNRIAHLTGQQANEGTE